VTATGSHSSVSNRPRLQFPMQRRDFLRGLGGATIAIAVAPELLTGCASEGSTGSAASTKELNFWWNPSVESSQQMTKWMDQVILDFQATTPGSKVIAVPQPSEQLVGNFRAACLAKSGPGLQFQYAGPYTMQWVWQQCVAPLDDLLDSSTLSHILPQNSLAEYKFKGKLWALPWFNAPVVLMYNKSLFKKAGLDPDAPPKTFDELINASKQLRAKGIIPWGYGLKNLTGIGNFSGLFNMQSLDNPKEMLQPVLGHEAYTTPKYSEWLSWVQELIRAKVFNDDVTSLEYGDSQNMFLAGKSAIAISSSLTNFQKTLGEDLGLLLPPKVGTGSIAGLISYNPHPLFVTSFAKDKGLAAKFLKYLHTPSVLDGLYESSGSFPADDGFDKTKITTPQDKQLFEFLSTRSTLTYQNFWPSQMDRENVFLAVQSVFAGSRTPAKAAQDVEQRLAGWRKSQPGDLANFTEWAGA